MNETLEHRDWDDNEIWFYCALLNCCFAVVNKEHFIYDYILDKRQLNTHILHWTFLLEQQAINILLNVVNAVQELVTTLSSK